MNVSLGENMGGVDVYVALLNGGMGTYYYLECDAHSADYFTAFGWKTTREASDDTYLPNGGVCICNSYSSVFDLFFLSLESVFCFVCLLYVFVWIVSISFILGNCII